MFLDAPDANWQGFPNQKQDAASCYKITKSKIQNPSQAGYFEFLWSMRCVLGKKKRKVSEHNLLQNAVVRLASQHSDPTRAVFANYGCGERCIPIRRAFLAFCDRLQRWGSFGAGSLGGGKPERPGQVRNSLQAGSANPDKIISFEVCMVPSRARVFQFGQDFPSTRVCLNGLHIIGNRKRGRTNGV